VDDLYCITLVNANAQGDTVTWRYGTLAEMLYQLGVLNAVNAIDWADWATYKEPTP
jgi:hypothetical protein